MKKSFWFMEGLSSQRDIIFAVRQFAQQRHQDITLFASHKSQRNEILSVADFSLIEPKCDEHRLSFIHETVEKWGINAIHSGHNSHWFERHRAEIEQPGLTLTTGSAGLAWLRLADDKVTFAALMEKHGLPAVPSIRITTPKELQYYLENPPFSANQLCIKPVTGIYGMGFWRFDNQVSATEIFNHPGNRVVRPEQYLTAFLSDENFSPQVLMPYLDGQEYSVDILAKKGKVLAAVARRKEGSLQYLENHGAAYELAISCASIMQADGLVNVQTRNDANGKPVLLEINMRPSGGIGYTLQSGVNLPGLFAFLQLGLFSEEEVTHLAAREFIPVTVRPVTKALHYPVSLTNCLN